MSSMACPGAHARKRNLWRGGQRRGLIRRRSSVVGHTSVWKPPASPLARPTGGGDSLLSDGAIGPDDTCARHRIWHQAAASVAWCHTLLIARVVCRYALIVCWAQAASLGPSGHLSSHGAASWPRSRRSAGHLRDVYSWLPLHCGQGCQRRDAAL